MVDYIITDTHFYHPLMLKYRSDDYDLKIIKGLNKLNEFNQVILYHLGDLGWHNNKLIANHIAGLEYTKVLIKGNHDKKSASLYYKMGFTLVVNQIMIKKYGHNIYLTHKPVKLLNDDDINLHGHFHDIKYDRIKLFEQNLLDLLTPNHYLLSLEKDGYNPLKLETIMKQIAGKKRKPTLEVIK